MFSGIRRIVVPRISPEKHEPVRYLRYPETEESLPVLSSGLHPRQCDNDGLWSRAVRVLHHAENPFI